MVCQAASRLCLQQATISTSLSIHSPASNLWVRATDGKPLLNKSTPPGRGDGNVQHQEG